MVSSLTIAERSSEVNALGGDILLIAVLPVAAEDIFDGPKVAGLVVVSGGIFDVVKIEFVFTGGCDGRAGVGTGALEARSPLSVFLATERLDTSRVEALDQSFEQYRLDALVSDELGKCGERYRFCPRRC